MTITALGQPNITPSLRRRLRLRAWFAVDTLVSLAPVARRPDRVLIVRLDRIGDLVLWLDAAQTIAAFYRGQGKEVVLLANDLWAGWVGGMRIFDRVVPLHLARFESNLLHRFAAGLAIRRLGCGVAVSPVHSRSWAAGDAVVRLCGATERIGSEGDPRSGTALERRLANRWYTRLIPASAGPRMEIERNAEFAAGLTGAPHPARVADLRALVPPAEPAVRTPYYVLFPGASAPGRRWPVERFQEIATRMHRETGWTGVVCGGPEDVELGRKLCAGTAAKLMDRTGETTLAQLTQILAHAQMLVANDTSAVHIAAALGVPAVCIVGGGHPGRFLPYPAGVSSPALLPIAVDRPMDCFGCDWRCIHLVPASQPKPCIAEVTVEAIWREVAARVARRTPG